MNISFIFVHSYIDFTFNEIIVYAQAYTQKCILKMV